MQMKGREGCDIEEKTRDGFRIEVEESSFVM